MIRLHTREKMAKKNKECYKSSRIIACKNRPLRTDNYKRTVTRSGFSYINELAFEYISRNLCENPNDKTKNSQSKIHKELISEHFPNNRQVLTALALDTIRLRTHDMLMDLDIRNITLIDFDEETINSHKEKNIKCHYSTLHDYASEYRIKYNIMILDTESCGVTWIQTFTQMIRNEMFGDKCLLYINCSNYNINGKGKGKSNRKLYDRLDDIKTRGVSFNQFQHLQQILINNASNKYKFRLLKEKLYSPHRDNIIRRGAQMYSQWWIIIKR